MVIRETRHNVMSRALIFILVASVHGGIAQRCKTPLEGHLLIAEGDAIYKVDANGQNREVYVESPDGISIDYNYENNILYWSDLESRQVYSLSDKTSTPNVVIPGDKSWLPFSFSLVGDKIYVVDSFSDTVRVFDSKNNQGIVIGANVTSTRKLAVDVEAGYLFVLDKYRILRAELDGANPEIIYAEYGNRDELSTEIKNIVDNNQQKVEDDSSVYRRALSVVDIKVDFKTKRIYWVNTLTRTVESSDYFGNDKKVHFRDQSVNGNLESLASIALLGEALYWADDISQKVFKIDVKSGKTEIILKNVNPQNIYAVSCSNYQQAPKSCGSNNGQCQQLCVLSKSSSNNYRCGCNIGYELTKDGKTCVSVQDFILFTHNEHIKGQSLTADGKIYADVINPSNFRVGRSTLVDFNAEDRVVYYNSLHPNNQLHQIGLDNGKHSVLQPDLLSKDVRFIAYDWVTKNIYYFTYYFADTTTLSVTNVRNPIYSKILIENVERLVRAITIHPNKGYLYFSQTTNNKSIISRIATDGSGLTVVYKLENGASIDALAIDYDQDRLYWTEVKQISKGEWETKLRHSNLNGKDVQDVPVPKDLKRPSSLTVQSDAIFLVVGPQQALVRLDRKTNELVTLVDVDMVGTVSGVKVFSRASQKVAPKHPCSGSHNCEKFCFAVPKSNGDLKGVCGCPYGEKLAADGKSCVDNSKAEPPFKPCKFSFKCNKQTE